MRQSLVTLMIVGAFALGLVIGGQSPREASAQDTYVEGIEWTNDGVYLTFTNTSETDAFAVVGWQKDGEKAQFVPPRTNGKLVVAAAGLESVTVYKMQAALACSPRECVLCDIGNFGGTHCPIPGWPPRGTEFRNITGPPSWAR